MPINSRAVRRTSLAASAIGVKGMIKPLAGLACMLILIAMLGSTLWAFLSRWGRLEEWNADFIIGVTAFSIGVVTFFGVTALNRAAQEPQAIDDERLRTAVACSLVISYLYMVAFTTFVGNAPTIGPVTKEFIESFSSVIGITIAFYFGASAATQIFGRGKVDQAQSKTVETVAPPK
jgi:hypothetical protein